MEKMDGMSMDLRKENVERIKELFPNVVTEGKINFDSLRIMLGDEIDDSKEKYQFTWNGKTESIKIAQSPSSATLRPCREKSKDWDTTENLYIEGDNLEVLKQLQKTYFGKIKMIYIDPPYNTGSDFVYKDDFKDSIENYKTITSQSSSSNPEANGRFHTDWLNMMYPRLILSKNLLTKDGVIFISIDYHENYNMRAIANEVFGESKFIGEIYWESKTKSQNTATSYNKLQPKAEMILVYSMDEKRRFNLIKIGDIDYPMSDEKGKYREYPVELMNSEGVRGRATMIYDITDGVSTVSPPTGKQWQLGQDQVATYKEAGDLFIRDGKAIIKMRPEYERGEKTEPFWGLFSKELGTAESAKKDFNEILPDTGFETVKPVEILRRLIFHATNENDIILDFFSGSGTAAHACILLNAEDCGKRKFIMVQIPELVDENSKTYKEGFKTICEIGEERIRRAGKQIQEDLKEKKAGEDHSASDDAYSVDTGFKVFKLDSTNINPWDNTKEYDEKTIFDMVAVFKSDRSREDILYEIMLKYGLFDRRVCELSVNGKTLYQVGDDDMLVCLDDRIDDVDISEIAKLNQKCVVFKEEGFKDDNAKINAEYNLKKSGFEDVKVI